MLPAEIRGRRRIIRVFVKTFSKLRQHLFISVLYEGRLLVGQLLPGQAKVAKAVLSVSHEEREIVEQLVKKVNRTISNSVRFLSMLSIVTSFMPFGLEIILSPGWNGNSVRFATSW
jgi:hypothetical protein